MAERSDPLGPPTDVFPIEDYDMVGPEADDFIDEVRIELLTMKPCLDKAADPGPKWFDAAMQFAIDGVSWPLRLTYDVNFICAWPCTRGPHPLFYDYTYLKVKADEIIAIRDWAGLYGAKSRVNMDVHKAASVRSSFHEDEDTTSDSATGESSWKASKGRPASATPSANSNGHVNSVNGYGAEYGSEHEMDDKEKVLVIEAFGVPDNEVLARAWCAHWGMSAVVADISRTWYVMNCVR